MSPSREALVALAGTFLAALDSTVVGAVVTFFPGDAKSLVDREGAPVA